MRRSKFLFLIIIIAVIISCVMADSYVSLRATDYRENSKYYLEEHELYQSQMNIDDNKASQSFITTVSEQEITNSLLILWSTTKDTNYLNEANADLNQSNSMLKGGMRYLVALRNDSNSSLAYLIKADSSDNNETYLNVAFQQLEISTFFFSIALIPLTVEESEDENKLIGVSFVIFVAALTSWIITFIQVVPLLR